MIFLSLSLNSMLFACCLGNRQLLENLVRIVPVHSIFEKCHYNFASFGDFFEQCWYSYL